MRFDAGGQLLFDDWRADLEQRLRSVIEHPAIEAHLAKYRSLVPSIAFICHLMGESGLFSKRRWHAQELRAEYLESHARRLYRSVTHGEAEAARRLAAKLLGR